MRTSTDPSCKSRFLFVENGRMPRTSYILVLLRCVTLWTKPANMHVIVSMHEPDNFLYPSAVSHPAIYTSHGESEHSSLIYLKFEII